MVLDALNFTSRVMFLGLKFAVQVIAGLQNFDAQKVAAVVNAAEQVIFFTCLSSKNILGFPFQVKNRVGLGLCP